MSVILVSCAMKMTNETKTALEDELKEMIVLDQIAASPRGLEWAKYNDSVFNSHGIRVKKMFDKYGFLGFDKVGKKGSYDFWLIVQHSNTFPEFQKKVLKEMDKQVKKKNANAEDYAYLFDRVATNSGAKQKFGTQVSYAMETTGRAFPKNGLLDPVNVDQSRKEYNLGPLKEYLNFMSEQHYEMNKTMYQKMGITKPNLY